MKTIQLQPRDRAFLWALYKFDGVLATRQVREHYYKWRTPTKRYPRRKKMANSTFWNRMRQLRLAEYIEKPTRQQLMKHPVPEMVYWLGLSGIALIAAKLGISENFDKAPTEHAQKRLAESLRRKDVRWKRTPDWYRLRHHIAVCDVRFLIKKAAKRAGLRWERWVPESQWRAEPPRVTYDAQRREQGGRLAEETKTSAVYPDGFFVVARLTEDDKLEPLAYFVECDFRTEDNHRVAKERVLPGAALLANKALLERLTGYRYARWLTITTGSQRVENMKQAAESETVRRWFYYTSFDQLSPEKFFSQSIWQLTGHDKPVSLLTNLTK